MLRSFEALPDEILINVFRHLAPNVVDSSNQTTSLFQDTDHELWHPLTGEGCVNDDGGSSASGRQALSNACVLSKRIAPYAQRALYQSVTPSSNEFPYSRECDRRSYRVSLQQSIDSETYKERFRHARTLVCKAKNAASIAAVLGSTESLESLQIDMHPTFSEESITIMRCIGQMSSLRQLDLCLDYLESPYREEVARTALQMEQLTELTLSSPGRVPLHWRSYNGPHLRSLCLNIVDEVALQKILERIDVSQLARLSMSSDSEDISVVSLDARFASLKTLTLDNLTTLDMNSLRDLPSLDTLALGFNSHITSGEMQDIFDGIPRSVMRLRLLSLSWRTITIADIKAEDLAHHVKVIQFPLIAACIGNFRPSRSLAVAQGIFALAAYHIESNGIAVLPDEPIRRHVSTAADIEALGRETLAVIRAEQELYDPQPVEGDEVDNGADA